MTVKIAMPLPVSAGLVVGTDGNRNDSKNGWGKCSGFAVGGGELRVFRDLRLERIDGREFLLRTDEREKIQVRRFTVNIGVEIQDVRFDRHRERADGGLQADVHHGLVPGTVREDDAAGVSAEFRNELEGFGADRKSTRLNSSHQIISYAVFCLKKKNEPPRPELKDFIRKLKHYVHG